MSQDELQEGVQGIEWARAACRERELRGHEIWDGAEPGKERNPEHGWSDDNWIEEKRSSVSRFRDCYLWLVGRSGSYICPKAGHVVRDAGRNVLDLCPGNPVCDLLNELLL